MSIGAKLLFAFTFVILIMTLGCAGYTLYIDYTYTRSLAAEKLRKAVHEISDPATGGDLDRISNANAQLADAILHDKSVMEAFSAGDKKSLANEVKSFISKTNFNGFVTFIDKDGWAILSTDGPQVPKYSVSDQSAVEVVLKRGVRYSGAACLTQTGSLTASGIVPIMSPRQGIVGALAVNTPLNLEFLTGLVERLAVSQDHLSNIDICVLNGKDKSLVNLTPDLITNGGPFVKQLHDRGLDAIPGELPIPKWVPWPRKELQGFEAGGRWWKQLFLPGLGNHELIGEILVTTPVPDMAARLTQVLFLASACGGVGLLFAMYFASGISKDVNEPLRFLIHRTEDIANQRTALPPLEGLTGDWLELGEQIDTAMQSMRSTVQSLKQQLGKQQQETQEHNRQSDDADVQLDALNRQFSQQSKQLTEATKQMSAANRQVVLLQHKLDAVLQCSTEGFLILDQFGNVLGANPVFLNWLGGTEGEIAGRLCFDLVKRPGEQPNPHGEGQAFARHGGDPSELINQFYPEGIVYHRDTHNAIEVLAHLQPIMSEESGITAYIMVLRDKSLRTEIAQLRSEIVSVLSDSIRAPLADAEVGWANILNTAAQMMHPSVGQPLAELHKHYEQLLSLVDSLLLYYGGFVPPPVVIREQVVIPRLVADCLEEVAPMARSNQLSLDYKSSSGLPPVGMNKEVMRKILADVLVKMISITAPGGRVRVESMMKGQELRIGVQSSGPALPEHEITEMFAGFIDGRHHEATYGARLAMYLARNSVERLGGKIWAVSEQGRGTVIYFGVPVQPVG